ncbi:MAG TPA: aldo/keto reductase [Ignavibacteriaceae bacterium]|nr:aldo/keto reductase [Ignavibacteriaceae bacterium]
MEYKNLGKSGLKVSRICLGCMSFGSPQSRKWMLNEVQARPIIKKALESGINFFDTANMYAEGLSEEITGRALTEFAKRAEMVIATKLFFPMRKDVNGRGLSRKEIFTEVEMSLRRLRTDYIDLYQIHRWDYETPIEETLEALHDVVKAGKVRYVGASSMFAWQFCKSLYLAELNGWTRFVSMQPYYNLLYREEEREMLPLCQEEGIGVIPWSPLARGHLARSWEKQSDTLRATNDPYGQSLYEATRDVDEKVVGKVTELAKIRGVSQAQISLAWLFSKPVVTAPIVGTTQLHHLEDAIAALSVKLSDEEIQILEAQYVPHAVTGIGVQSQK